MSETKETPQWRKVIERPFRFSELHILPKTKPYNGKVMPLVYFDARHCYARFDEAFGIGCWHIDDAKPIMSGGQLVGVTGSLYQRCGDDVDAGWYCRATEMGAASDIEPAKGAFSDLVKRLMVPLGHRWLYEIDLGWQPCEINDKGAFKKWTAAALKDMEAKYTKQITALVKGK